MNQSPLLWKVKRIVKEQQKGRIVFNSYLQRNEDQWSLEDKSKLIESLLYGYVVPPVYAHMQGEVYDILDGLQRLSTIRTYFENKFALVNNMELIEIEGIEYDLSGMYFKDLPDEVREVLEDAEINMTKLENYTPKQLKIAFCNLNRSCPLSKDQLMRPELGEYLVREIESILNENFMKNKTNFTPLQLHKQENQTTILICLMLVNGYSYRSFLNEHIVEFARYYGENYIQEEIDKCKEIFNKLDDIFETKENVLGKLNVVSFFNIVKIAEELDVSLQDTKEFLNNFIDNYSDKKEYISMLSGGTASKKKVNHRLEIITNEFMNFIDKKGLKSAVNE